MTWQIPISPQTIFGIVSAPRSDRGCDDVASVHRPHVLGLMRAMPVAVLSLILGRVLFRGSAVLSGSRHEEDADACARRRPLLYRAAWVHGRTRADHRR